MCYFFYFYFANSTVPLRLCKKTTVREASLLRQWYSCLLHRGEFTNVEQLFRQDFNAYVNKSLMK
jgi:hypothetical protein